MADPVRLLILEDRPEDAALMLREIERSGFVPQWERVETEAGYRARLSPALDAILADYRLPTFDAMRALRILKERALDVPLLIVTGSIDEETAVACMREGAADYVLKDRMTRLGEALRAALRQRDLRLQNRRAAEDLRRKERELYQSQKLEAVGRLAGGIAHDFNNLLTVISACTDLLAASASVQERDRECVEEIRSSTRRAALLTGSLLSFSRRRGYSPSVRDLNEIVAGVATLLRRVIGENVTLVTALGAHSPAVRVDAAQIDQVLLNLVVNARDAMPGGGRIEIETADTNAAGEVVTGRGDAPGTHVRLRVRDTGTGIPPEALAHLFEPFFTTKPAGKGTGLGLSTASSIVTRSGGTMRAESAPGEGAAFDVILPRATAAPAFAARAPPSAPTPKAASSAAETILVVEDEAPIRRFLRLLLEGLGYRVLEAPDGPEALALAATLPRVDLLVSDVVMPGMNGPLLACRLREAHPESAILFISGYIESETAGEASPPGARFLEKPFTREELARTVRELLDARAGVAIGI